MIYRMKKEETLIEWIRLYKIKEIEKEFWTYYRKIVWNNDFIPVKIQDSINSYRYKKGLSNKDYSIRYIRRQDIEEYLKTKIQIKL